MTGVQTCALPICFPVTIGGYGYYEDVESLIVCEKDRKRCEVYHNEDDGLKLVRAHDDVIMGKSGDKIKRGDLKTPVGVYEITKRFKPMDQFYGPLAFVLSYPNLFDVLRGKNGDGIYLRLLVGKWWGVCVK